MLVYADSRPKELNVNQFSRIQAYLARYIVRILIWLWRKYLFSVLIKIHKCVSLSFYAHINIVIMHDDVASFLKGKHVDGCSFF